MIGIGLFLRPGSGAGGSAFNPASLFVGSDAGVVYDLTDKDALAQLSNGTTAVTAEGQPIGWVFDAAPGVKPATQATAGFRPIYAGYPRTLGTEIVTNGELSSGASWTAGTGWAVTGGKAVKTAGTASIFSQAVTVTAGQAVMLFYCILRTAGSVTARLTGGTTVADAARSNAGSYNVMLFPVTGNTTLEFSADASFSGSVYLISMRPVSQWVTRGAWFDGADDKLQSLAVDLSATDKATVLVSCQYNKPEGTAGAAIEVVNYWSNTPGSALVIYDANPSVRLRGSAAQVSVGASSEGRSSFPVAHITEGLLDLSQPSTATQITLYERGFIPTPSVMGVTAGTGSMGNGVVAIGGAVNGFVYLRGLVHRVLVINRLLSAGELVNARGWATQGMAICAAIGDSTVGINNSGVGLSHAVDVPSFVGGMISAGAMLATAGENIAQQKTRWTALGGKSALKAVFVQVGLNDIRSRVGGNTATATQVIADLQDLVTTVNADKPAGCKTYICGLTPCKLWLDGATNPVAAYAAWLAINEAISGLGATPITGVDARITSYVATLNDGSGNLIAKYDHNADGVHESNEARFIVAQAWRSQLEADGLVSS
jgi:hypothetical protein